VLLAVLVLLVPQSLPEQQASVGAGWAGTAPPQAGSTVDYELRTSFTTPDGSYRRETTARLSLTYEAGRWSGTCSGEAREAVDGVVDLSTWSAPSEGPPAFAPAGAQAGETVTVELLDGEGIADGCRAAAETVVVEATDGQDGKAVTGSELEETAAYQDVSITWDRDTGLVSEWTRLVRGGSASGRLVGSDAAGR
jgi:hypothetical protein